MVKPYFENQKQTLLVYSEIEKNVRRSNSGGAFIDILLKVKLKTMLDKFKDKHYGKIGTAKRARTG